MTMEYVYTNTAKKEETINGKRRSRRREEKFFKQALRQPRI